MHREISGEIPIKTLSKIAGYILGEVPRRTISKLIETTYTWKMHR